MLSKKGCTFFIVFTGREKVEVWNCSDQKSSKYTTKYVLVHKTWRKKKSFLYKQVPEESLPQSIGNSHECVFILHNAKIQSRDHYFVQSD